MSRSSGGEQWPEVVWKEHLRRPLKESLLFRMGGGKTALLQHTSKKGCASKGRVSRGKLGNLRNM